VRRPATSPRRNFQRGRCRCAARTPTGVPPPPPIGGRRAAEATRHGCLLRGVAGTEHVNRRARLSDLLSCPPARAAASGGTDTVGWKMKGSDLLLLKVFLVRLSIISTCSSGTKGVGTSTYVAGLHGRERRKPKLFYGLVRLAES